MTKPLAERIYAGKRVVYRCFACNTSFAMLGDKIAYCYNCGEQVDWDGIKTSLEKPLSEIKADAGFPGDLDEFELLYIDALNVNQIGEPFTRLYHADKSPLSCEECRYAHGSEYCTIPEEKKKIIPIPRRIHYCQSAICNRFEVKGANKGGMNRCRNQKSE